MFVLPTEKAYLLTKMTNASQSDDAENLSLAELPVTQVMHELNIYR